MIYQNYDEWGNEVTYHKIGGYWVGAYRNRAGEVELYPLENTKELEYHPYQSTCFNCGKELDGWEFLQGICKECGHLSSDLDLPTYDSPKPKPMRRIVWREEDLCQITE